MSVLLVLLVVLDLRLRARGGSGMLDLELAGSQTEAQHMIDRWAARIGTARAYLAADTLFIPAAVGFWLMTAANLTRLASEAGHRKLSFAGKIVAPLPALIGALDLAENTALLMLLGKAGGAAAPLVTKFCSLLTLVLAGVVVGFVLISGISLRREATALDVRLSGR